MTIAESLKRFREKYGLNISQVAKVADISVAGYAYEEGRKRNGEKQIAIPNAEIIIKIAKYYQVSSDYLLGLTDDPRPVNQILAEMATAPNSSESSTVNQLPNSTQTGDYQNQITALQVQIKSMQAQINNLQGKLDKVSKIFAADD